MTKIELILDRLHQLTSEGKIAWERTADPMTYSAVLGNSSAVVDKEPFDLIFNFKLLNSSGNDIESLNSTQFDHLLIEQLWDMARRRALNIDAELDNVLVELNQL